MSFVEVMILKKNGPLTEARFGELLDRASDEYKNRAAKMRRPAAENLLLGEALARRMISAHTGAAPESLVFARSPHGKPFVCGYEDAHFNISHSGVFVACALSPAPVGIDVQTIGPARMNIAKRFFTENEYRYVEDSPDPEIRFCRVWTMKESYLKRDGLGISGVKLNSFDVLEMPRGIFHEIPLDGLALLQICSEQAGFNIRVSRLLETST